MAPVTTLVVLGTRPEAIKVAPVIRALRADPDFHVMVCATGQHREMLDSALDLFGITPDHDLAVMRPGQDLTDVTGAVLVGLRDLLRNVPVDLVLVQGDTTTTMAATLAAYYARIPVGHIEAGLRTGDIYAPWPEEVNRRIATAIATWHFAPTEQARRNLLAEQVPQDRVFVTGNTVVDALLDVVAGIRDDQRFREDLDRRYPFLGGDDGWRGERQVVLVTGHRRESFGQGFESICEALRQLAQRPDVTVVYPVHLNPNVREPVFRLLGDLPSVHLLEPLDYRTFVYFMARSRLILTDSGGVQEEAPSLGKPVLVMRDVTERAEGIDAGSVRLVGTVSASIVAEASRLLDDDAAYMEMARASNPYGDGEASLRIVNALRAHRA